jgi:hypothetical protein
MEKRWKKGQNNNGQKTIGQKKDKLKDGQNKRQKDKKEGQYDKFCVWAYIGLTYFVVRQNAFL